MVDAVQHAAAFAARESYGRLLAYLARSWRDVAAAEDALADAFAEALEHWPKTGVPKAPDTWLLTVAKRKLLDHARHLKLRERPDVIAALMIDDVTLASDIPDERLRLMWVCTHPAIDAAIRPALILQVVLGVEAKTMASAFVTSPEAMTKRLVRAKSKIRQAGIGFEEPPKAEAPERLRGLLEAIYAAYFLGSENMMVAGDASDALRQEALYLAHLVTDQLPDQAESLGFLAMLCFCESRRQAQLNSKGEFVPLLEQDTKLWNSQAMARGYTLLAQASKLQDLGPFQLEAAIHAAHCYRARSGVVPWQEIATLYEKLITLFPTLGAEVSHAVAIAYAHRDPKPGIALLHAMDVQRIQNYQPYWAALGHLHEMHGNKDKARTALTQALGLTQNPRIQNYLKKQLSRAEV